MASVHTNVSRGLILALLGVLAFVFIMYGRPASTRESVQFSTLACIQTVCIENKTTGNLCTVGEARISEILIESDPNNFNIRNIRVIPSDDRCQ